MRSLRARIAALCAIALLGLSASAQAKVFPYEFDPVLSLRGNCGAPKTIDPVPDPSCTGSPPEYPAPPNRPQEFERTVALAIDSYGDEYVFSFGTNAEGDERIDVFDDEGRFLTEFPSQSSPGGSVLTSMAVDSKGNLYTFAGLGDVKRYAPSKYKPETGQVEYANAPVTVGTGSHNGAVAIDASNDHLYVARNGPITEYGSAEEANAKIESFESGGIGPWTEALAIDAQRGRIFVSGCRVAAHDCFIRALELDVPHATLAEIDGSTTPAGKFAAFSGRLPTAVDEETGRFFISDFGATRLYEFEPNFAYRSQITHSLFQQEGKIALSNGENATGDANNRHYLFATTYENNRVLAFSPPAVQPPDVKASLSGVSETEATLQATVDPNGADTEYSFQYTSQAAFEAEGFEGAQTALEGTLSGSSLPKLLSAPLSGLAPGGAYRFRVLAHNEVGDAEPLSEGAFTTYEDPTATSQCPNQALRTGASAALADCRAFELVTPGETSGREPRGASNSGTANTFPTVLSSPEGNTASFVIQGGSLPGSNGIATLNGDPYRATRGPSGWSTVLAGPSGTEATRSTLGSPSPDQGYSFLAADGEGPLVIVQGTAAGVGYLHYPDGHSEPIGRGSLGIEPVPKGVLITEDAAHVVFQSFNLGFGKAVQLEPNAPPDGTTAVYDRTIDPITGQEQTHVVSLLPGDVTPAAGEDATYVGASKDGNGIAFAIGADSQGIGGSLYLRVDNTTTYEIGEDVAFAGVSEGGRRVFYLEEGDLKAFDTSTEEAIPFSESGDVTPVNVAPGGARAYFTSPSQLGGTNPEGELPVEGGQNLYLSEEGQVSFIGVLTDFDVKGEPLNANDGLEAWTRVLSSQPALDPSRTNPDGSVLLFTSRAKLTAYDPEGAPEVYRYDSKEPSLECLSCIPTGAPAGAGAAIQSYAPGNAASAPLNPFNFLPGLTPDGKRAFFESTEALVSADTDGKRDVYEWEAQGVGSCTRAGGCVYLISSGHSATEDFLYAQSTDGDNVFFTSGDRLLPEEDPSATPSIYDARVNGGFATATVAGECLGEACQPAASAPTESLLGSAALRGQGNVKPEAHKRKQKHKRKHHHRRRKATKNGRAPR